MPKVGPYRQSYGFSNSHVDVRVGPQRRLSAEELMLLNFGVGELFRVPWTAKRSNQSILKEVSCEYSLEGLMLKLKLQYFGQLMQIANSLEKTLMLEKIEAKGSRVRYRMEWLDDIMDSMDMNLSKLRDSEGQGNLVCCNP